MGTGSESVAQDQLKSFVRRIESEEDVKKAANEALSDIYKEARGDGFDVKVLRKVIADRRKDSTERNEFEAIYDLYWSALHGVVHAHVEIIEEFDAETGEILEPTIHSSDAAETGAEDASGARPDEAPQTIQPVTANELQAQETGIAPNEARPASVDANANNGGLPGQSSDRVTGGESAADLTTGHTPTGPLTPADDRQVDTHSPEHAPEQPRQGYVLPAPKPLRPHCQAVGTDRACPGQGRQHCGSCKSTAEAAGKVAA